MDHFIITRVNRKLPGPRSAAKRHDLDWIAYRFSLMDQFAIPSMARQTRQGFVWAWEVDPESPKKVLAVIERKAAEANAKLVFDREWYPDKVILMSRVDSDDFLLKRFVERVQAIYQADDRRPLAIDAPEGWTGDREQAWPFINPGSSFVSLAANPHKHGDVWQCTHRELVRRFPCVAATGRLWCRVVHGENLTNRLKNYEGPGVPISRLLDA